MTNEQVAVVGLGFLGRGIAACLLAHGFRVIGYSRSSEGLATGRQNIASAMDELASHGAIDDSARGSWHARYTETTALETLAECTFVIESVAEDIGTKAKIFDAIERVVDAGTPIASNTSAIPITALQASRKHPGRFVGMHWAEPAYVTRFLEVIRGELTEDDALDKAVDLARRCGKEPSLIQRDVPGFVANRLGYAMYREALHLLELGVADMETIDRSFRNSVGLWATLCGPLRWIDLTGGPALYAKAMAPVMPTLNCDSSVSHLLTELAEQDAQGIFNGRGLYDYAPEEAARWEELLRRHAWAVNRLVDDIPGGETA